MSVPVAQGVGVMDGAGVIISKVITGFCEQATRLKNRTNGTNNFTMRLIAFLLTITIALETFLPVSLFQTIYPTFQAVGYIFNRDKTQVKGLTCSFFLLYQSTPGWFVNFPKKPGDLIVRVDL